MVHSRSIHRPGLRGHICSIIYLPFFGMAYIHHSCMYEIANTDNVHSETQGSEINYCISMFLTNEPNPLSLSRRMLRGKEMELYEW